MQKNKKKNNKKNGNFGLVLGIIIVALIVGAICYFKFVKGNDNADTNATVDSSHSYVVSTSNQAATEIGEKVLAEGGNAVDAAIAVSYSLGVAQPYASGIGGGGGMLIYDPSADEYKFYDYKDCAPFSNEERQSDVGVPGFVAGMEKISKDYGKTDLSTLIGYSVDLARNGVEVNEDTVKAMDSFSSLLSQDEDYLKDGSLLKEGDTLVQSELADTLENIQKNGSKAFYSGEIAENIAKAGSMDASDLSKYEVKINEPVSGEFNGYKVVSAPPPFSGTPLIQMLEIIEKQSKTKDINDVSNYLEVLDTATTLSNYDRGKKMSDLDFNPVDYNKLTTDEYITNLLKEKGVTYSEDDESESTTHFVIVDKDGMVVSCTNTLGHFYGSQKKVNGFYLNSSLKSFGTKGINKYEPGKRPRTYTCPTIIQKGDDYIMGIGTPGGVRILKMLAPILVDNLYFGKDLQESINKSRVIFYEPGVLMLEDGRDEDYIIDVSNCAYPYVDVKDQLYFGAVQAGGISDGHYFGASDNRRLGKVSISDK